VAPSPAKLDTTITEIELAEEVSGRPRINQTARRPDRRTFSRVIINPSQETIMLTKQKWTRKAPADKTSEKGAVELTEDELEHATGGTPSTSTATLTVRRAGENPVEYLTYKLTM
jgi:hypothetical protein